MQHAGVGRLKSHGPADRGQAIVRSGVALTIQIAAMRSSGRCPLTDRYLAVRLVGAAPAGRESSRLRRAAARLLGA
jgi:hypothetical protein